MTIMQPGEQENWRILCMKVEVIGVIEVEPFMIMILVVQFFSETIGLTVLILALVILVFALHKITQNKIRKIFLEEKKYE